MKNLLFVAIVLCLSALAIADKLMVCIYYEALCPDSKNFITQQLYPLFQDMEIKERLNVTLLPFGKASYKENKDSFEFTCEHGPDECKANIYQACALKKLGLEAGLNYANCMMKEKSPIMHLESCAKQLNLDFKDLTACHDSKALGQTYLKELGDLTLSHELKSIPSIIFNKKFDTKLQSESVTNFKMAVCSQLKENKPKSC